MQSMVCGNCGASWTEPDMLTDEQRCEVAALVRSGTEIAAMRQIREGNQLSLRDAKAIALHITRTPGTCHRCSYPLGGEATAHCPYCRAINYDW